MQENACFFSRRKALRPLKLFSLRTSMKSLVQMELLAHIRNIQRKAFSEKYLLATNMTIAFVLSLLGDILEQHFEHNINKTAGAELKYDLVRTRNMGLSGCLVDVICHYWYQYLERHMPEHTPVVIIKKILLDQLICTPIYISAFFITLGILEQETPQQILRDLRTKAWNLYLVEWMIWPAAQFINFYWVPCRYRVLYDNAFALGFDIYTSRLKHFDDGMFQSERDSIKPVNVLINKINQSVLNNY